jgi:hypothetical protein
LKREVLMATTTTLGDDIIIGTDAPDTLFGDTSGTLFDAARGGNDLIFGLGSVDCPSSKFLRQ